MQVRPRAGAAAAISILAMAVLALSPLAPAASAHPSEKSTCRASVLRLTAPGVGTIEPVVVQNAAGQACTAQTKNLLGPINVPGVISITAGSAKSTVSGTAAHPVATGELLNLSLSVPGLLSIKASILRATASAGGCTGKFGTPTSKPLLSSTGQVAGLTINGNAIAVDGNPVTLTLPFGIGSLSLNKVTTTANQITRQAFVLNVPLVGASLVISEAKAGFNGNPCDG